MSLSFGVRAATYDRLRPGYPPDAVVWALDGAFAREVLDLGAGTGAVTHRLAGRDAVVELDRVFAVEPDPRMREVLAGSLTDVATLDGTAEAIPLSDASVDAVLIGQAFHWFARPAADLEIARVLRPGGVLAILTNTNPNGADWEAALHERVLGFDQPSLTKRRTPLAPDLFTGERSAVWNNPNHLDHDDFLALTSTWSWVATATAAQQDHVIAEAERLFVAEAGADGVLELPYQLDRDPAGRAPVTERSWSVSRPHRATPETACWQAVRLCMDRKANRAPRWLPPVRRPGRR
jgi:SAM-dependent methyltransferase